MSIMKYPNFGFNIIQGDIVDGKFDGNGIQYHKDGSRHEGSWRNSKPNGLGVSVYSDQKFDIGEYKVIPSLDFQY